MNKKNKKTIGVLFISLITIIFILLFIYNRTITGNIITNLNTLQNNFCSDSDGNLALSDQSRNQGFVVSLQKSSECDWSHINKIDLVTNKECAALLLYNDYCINSKTLIEETCNIDGTVKTINIDCVNKCDVNKCI